MRLSSFYPLAPRLVLRACAAGGLSILTAYIFFWGSRDCDLRARWHLVGRSKAREGPNRGFVVSPWRCGFLV